MFESFDRGQLVIYVRCNGKLDCRTARALPTIDPLRIKTFLLNTGFDELPGYGWVCPTCLKEQDQWDLGVQPDTEFWNGMEFILANERKESEDYLPHRCRRARKGFMLKVGAECPLGCGHIARA